MTYFQDSHTTVYQGDVREVLRTLPERSVQCVVTSPPYWGLRSFGHYKMMLLWGAMDDFSPPRKHMERWWFRLCWRAAERGTGVFSRNKQSWIGALGLEPDPSLHVEHMVAVFREIRRVLRDDGTVWLNLGDGYAHGKPGGGSVFDKGRIYGDGGMGDSVGRPRGREQVATLSPGLKPKDLVGIPWRVAFALQADGWWLRSDIVWSKPNPMPESVRDRPTRSHEYVFLLTKRERYYYDADAIRERVGEETRRAVTFRNGTGSDYGGRYDGRAYPVVDDKATHGDGDSSLAGRNKRSVWEIATQPYPDAHFATFPEALVRPCILAGTSERACECGAPWERVTEETAEYESWRKSRQRADFKRLDDAYDGAGRVAVESPASMPPANATTGWRPTCKHEAETQPCAVLDPFAGSGTVALVARKAGRRAILIELSKEYCRLIVDRIGQGVLL